MSIVFIPERLISKIVNTFIDLCEPLTFDELYCKLHTDFAHYSK